MSLTPTAPSVAGVAGAGPTAEPRRVRHQARDVVALMAFSATTSTALAAGLLLLAHLSQQRALGRTMAGPSHVPVLLDRVVALLTPALGHEGAVLVDATLGLGGHSEAVLARCELARVVGIDRDPEALRLAGERLAVRREPLPRQPECLGVAVDADHPGQLAPGQERLAVATEAERRVHEYRALVTQGGRQEGDDPVEEHRDVGGAGHRLT